MSFFEVIVLERLSHTMSLIPQLGCLRPYDAPDPMPRYYRRTYAPFPDTKHK
jgi:hypothetical protein